MEVLFVFCLLISSTLALENGLARTPPMGWLSWERFACNTNCEIDPNNCISENLFRQMADIMVSEGYAVAGYRVVSIDDCWLARERDSRGRLQPDHERFPSGIKALADYVHSRGLDLGIYEDYGTRTCAGYPGILGHMKMDAQTFADWGIDYIKIDGCHSFPFFMDFGYTNFGEFLNLTGRPIVYSCSWPYYQTVSGIQVDWELVKKTCNLWRNYNDIGDSWKSVSNIISYYGDNQDLMAHNAGPGHWNDPDMLIVGNFGLSLDQSRAQMGMWAIFAAPLLMSADLRKIRPEHKEILLNSAVIAVNQDSLGIQGRRIYKKSNVEIWTKPMTPVRNKLHSYAVAFLYRTEFGSPTRVQLSLESLGMTSTSGYKVTDLFKGSILGLVVKIGQNLTFHINPTGIVLIKCQILE